MWNLIPKGRKNFCDLTNNAFHLRTEEPQNLPSPTKTKYCASELAHLKIYKKEKGNEAGFPAFF